MNWDSLLHFGFCGAVLCLVWGIVLSWRMPLSVLHVTFVFLCAIFVAQFVIGSEKGTFLPGYYFAVGVLSMLAGAALGRHARLPVREAVAPVVSETPNADRYLLFLFVSMILFWVGYHYAVGGAPLFSPNVEQARFDATTSGLFGIPGRMQRTGVLYALFFLSAYLQLVHSPPWGMRAWLAFTYVWVVTAYVLSGFKGAVIIVVIAAIIQNAAWPRWRSARRISFWKVAMLSLLALAAATLIGAIVVAHRKIPVNALELIVNRIFYLSGGPFFFVTNQFVPAHGFGFGEYLIIDLKYTLSVVKLWPDQMFNTTQWVSTSMHGIPITAEFKLPITMTLFGQAYLDFGLPGMVVVGVIAGLVMMYLFQLSEAAQSVLFRATLYYLQFAVFSAITKGNAVYDFADKLFTLGALWAMLAIATLLTKGPTGSTAVFHWRATPAGDLRHA